MTGRSPGSRVVALAGLPGLLQWHRQPDSPLTVAGTAADSVREHPTAFPLASASREAEPITFRVWHRRQIASIRLLPRGKRLPSSGRQTDRRPPAHGTPEIPADLPLRDRIRAHLPNSALLRWHLKQDGKVVQFEAQRRLILGKGVIARTAVLDSAGISFFIEQDVVKDIRSGQPVRLL